MHTDDSDVHVKRGVADLSGRDEDQLLSELVAHLREHRTKLRQQWATRIHDNHLLEAMTLQETAVEDHLGLRQLRWGAGDRQRRGAAALRSGPVRAASSLAAWRPMKSSASCSVA
jgi:hypothetical protein